MSIHTTFVGACALGAALALLPVAQAKLPPLSPEAKVKADEAKAKSAWSDKVAAYQLCKAQDRAAANYLKTAKAAGKEVAAPTPGAPCADPGPFVPPPAGTAGAQSPNVAAAAPPNQTQLPATQPAAGAAPAKK
jgi:hypothetical protein